MNLLTLTEALSNILERQSVKEFMLTSGCFVAETEASLRMQTYVDIVQAQVRKLSLPSG